MSREASAEGHLIGHCFRGGHDGGLVGPGEWARKELARRTQSPPFQYEYGAVVYRIT